MCVCVCVCVCVVRRALGLHHHSRCSDKMDTELLVDDPSSIPYVFSPITLFSCLFILFCAFVISPRLTSLLTPKNKQLGPHKAFINSLLGAGVHHLLVSALAMYALATGMIRNRAFSKAPLGFVLIQTTLGYFVGDLIVMLCDPVQRREPQVLSHHFVAIVGLTSVLYAQGKVMFVAVTFQVIELSSFLLNIIRALEKLDYRKDSLLYIATGFLMTITFFLTRVATIPWHWYEYLTLIATSEVVPMPLKFFTGLTYVFFDSLSLLWFSKILATARTVIIAPRIKPL